MKSTFTNHAKERLSERLKITEEEILELLTIKGCGRRIGCSRKKTHLTHRLLWSEVDENHFILIQDVTNGAILTVLTIDMYKRDYSMNLTAKRLQKAINVIKHINSKRNISEKRPKICTIFIDNDGRHTIKNIGKWKEIVPKDKIQLLGSNQDFWEWVLAYIVAKDLPLDNLRWVSGGYSIKDRVHIDYKIK